MANQPGEQNQQQSNAAPGTNDSYYTNQMQGSAQYGGSPTFIAPGLGSNFDPTGGQAQTYEVSPASNWFNRAPQMGTYSQYSYQPGDRGALFGEQQAMLNQMYNPQQIQAQKQAMLAAAQQANLAGQQGAQGQLAQMGLGSLGGQAGMLSGQAIQGALAEQQAMAAGAQLEQQALQNYMTQASDLRSQQAQVSNTVRQGYQDAINSLMAWPGVADGSQVVREELMSDLSEYSRILEQEVMAGEIEPGQAAVMMANYPYAWAAQNNTTIHRNRK
tara:strand:+ start:426 stop:1244 length:819 start_codon:yes stop_codon:yes gene_type:complete